MTKKSNSKLHKRISELERRAIADRKHIFELERRVTSHRKLDKLDITLLSVSSMFGLLFALLNYIIGDLAVIVLIPTLVIAWLMPSYVFVSTGVLSTKLTERVRAWIYFLTGFAFYFLMTTLILIGSYELLRNMWILSIVSILFSVLLIMWIFWANKKLTNIIFAWYGKKFTKKFKNEVYATGFYAFISATFISVSSAFIYLGLYVYQLYQILGSIEILAGVAFFSISGTIMLIFGAMMLVSFERSVRHK